MTDTKGWQPIESAPKGRILCWASGWEPCFLEWKTNTRISRARKCGDSFAMQLNESYWGDPSEMDDYDLARPGGGPTHWMPLPEPPQ